VLNKADMVDNIQLIRVYGALMYSLGKVLEMPEVPRVYIGSFWERPFQYDNLKLLFDIESTELNKDLEDLVRNSTLRKLSDLVKRSRMVKTHALIMSEIRNEMPLFGGSRAFKKKIIKNLPKIIEKTKNENGLANGDLPDMDKFADMLDKLVNKLVLFYL